jgi:hypothetical protein
MTSLRASNDFYLNKLIQIAAFLIHSMRDITQLDNSSSVQEIRKKITDIKKNKKTIERFRSLIKQKYPDLSPLIETVADVHCDYICIKHKAKKYNDHLIQDPILSLYHFTMQFTYEKPAVVYEEDDVHGSNVTKLKTALREEFLPSCIEIQFDPIVRINV